MPKLRERKRIIIEAIARMSNPTRDSLSEHTGIGLQSICGPVLELIRDGLVIETAERALTRAGSNAVVLRLADHISGGAE